MTGEDFGGRRTPEVHIPTTAGADTDHMGLS